VRVQNDKKILYLKKGYYFFSIKKENVFKELIRPHLVTYSLWFRLKQDVPDKEINVNISIAVYDTCRQRELHVAKAHDIIACDEMLRGIYNLNKVPSELRPLLVKLCNNPMRPDLRFRL